MPHELPSGGPTVFLNDTKGSLPVHACATAALDDDEAELSINKPGTRPRAVRAIDLSGGALGRGVVVSLSREPLAGDTVDLAQRCERPTMIVPTPIKIGQTLRERYVIESQLGAGGKGTVFKARDLFRESLPETDQHVALKVLHLDGRTVEQTVESLRREVHCAQMLSHSNIVNVYEQDRDGDLIFCTMELLQGDLLSSVLERHRGAPMDREQARQMIRQIGAGLQHAHDRGVVHGDLKPANIFVTRKGELRILDFGASRSSHARPSGAVEGVRQSVTLAYASCELLQGRTPDPRDDLYAFACISYELLTGQHPFNRRPANLVRDFGVTPKRPPHVGGRPWRALQTGLSWHRAARSISAQTFARRVTKQAEVETRLTPLEELKAWSPKRPAWRSHAVALGLATVLVAAAAIVQFREVSGRMLASAAPLPVPVQQAHTLPPVEEAAAVQVADTQTPIASGPEATPVAVAPVTKRPALSFSVDGYQVRSGDRFVEIRVRRNRLDKDTSFSWWTESATARQDVDYVHQAKAIQTFAKERGSTRLYVKLIPDTLRPQRDYFFVAIAQPGKQADQVTRTPIWLPIPRGQLQAAR